mgnify:CR=1 FL=1
MIHRYNPGHGKGGEYMGMEEDSGGQWCAYEDVAALEKRLAEATALLERFPCHRAPDEAKSLLSATPSPPAEPAPRPGRS